MNEVLDLVERIQAQEQLLLRARYHIWELLLNKDKEASKKFEQRLSTYLETPDDNRLAENSAQAGTTLVGSA